MGWVEKAHKKNKLYKDINRALNDPKYKIEEKKKLDEVYEKALDRFLLISADYLYRKGYRKKRLLNFLEFAVYQLNCIETYPEYFKDLNEAMEKETGINILKKMVTVREKAEKQIKEGSFFNEDQGKNCGQRMDPM